MKTLRKMRYSVVLMFRRLYLRWIYYPSAHWQETAHKARARAKYKCQRCGKNKPLDVHHLHYRSLWREVPRDLLAACRTCHNALHKRKFA